MDTLFGEKGAFNEIEAEDLANARLAVTRALAKLAKKSDGKATVTPRAPTSDPLKAPTKSASGDRVLANHASLSTFLKKDSFTDAKKALVVSFVGPSDNATVATKENWARIQACTNPVAVRMIAGEKLTLGEVFPMLLKQLSHLPACALMSATLSPESRETLGLTAPKKSASPSSPVEKSMNHTNYLWVMNELAGERWGNWPLPQVFTIERSTDTKAAMVAARATLDAAFGEVEDGEEMGVQDAFNAVVASLSENLTKRERNSAAASALWHNGLVKMLKGVQVQ